MPELFLDFETVSTVDIKRGAHLYAQHATPVLMGWAIDDEPAECVNFYDGDRVPQNVLDLIHNSTVEITAFNCDFERLIIENYFLDWIIPYERWFDVMLQAREHGLAGSLQTVAGVFGGSKFGAGSAELRKLIKLNDYTIQAEKQKRIAILKGDKEKIREIEYWLDKKRLSCTPNMELLIKYCKQDIEETRKLKRLLPSGNYPNNKKEILLASITAEMNDRGLPVDLDFVKRAKECADIAKTKLNNELLELTDGQVSSGYQYSAFSKFLTDRFGVSANTSTGEKSIEDLRERAHQYPNSKALARLLDVWLSKGVAVSKFDALINSTHPYTQRCYGTLAFCGAARTKRWGGRLYQPHNLKRPDLNKDELADAIFIVETQPPEIVAELYTVDELGDLVRPCITAEEGKILVQADLSAIESRSLRWFVNDEEYLKLFQLVDSGLANYDAYQITYAKAFGIENPAHVDDDQRFVGKVMELLLQYMGGVQGLHKGIVNMGADLDKFVRLVFANSSNTEIEWAEMEAREFGLRVANKIGHSEYTALAIARTRWRNANPRVVKFGKALERAFSSAINSPGMTFIAYNNEQDIAKRVLCTYDQNLDFLRMQLPVGSLYYAKPRIELVKFGKDDEAPTVKSITVRQASAKAPRTSYYAGKFLENVASGLSREIIGEGMIRAHAAGMNLLTMVHDEIVAEAMEYAGEEQLALLIDCMTRLIDGLPNFPIAAKGWVGKRYKK